MQKFNVAFSFQGTIVRRANVEAENHAQAVVVACEKVSNENGYQYAETETVTPFKGAEYEKFIYEMGSRKAIVTLDRE